MVTSVLVSLVMGALAIIALGILKHVCVHLHAPETVRNSVPAHSVSPILERQSAHSALGGATPEKAQHR